MAFEHQDQSYGNQPQRPEHPSVLRTPQLDLPTFSFRPLQLDPGARPAQPQPQQQPQQPHVATHAPAPQFAWQAAAPAPASVPFPTQMSAPAPTLAPAPTHAPPHAPTHAPAPAPRAMPQPMRTVPQYAAAPAAAADKTFLQKLTPAHMGVMMVMVTIMMIILNASPGASMRAPTTRALPALSGASATLPMTRGQLADPAAATKAKGKMRGIPSPAAATHMARRGTKSATLPKVAVLKMSGIPSPAAAQALGPNTLPLRPTSSTTLPGSAERDSHANESHYTAETTLGLERAAAPITMPAMTPGQAATDAQAMNNIEIAPDGNSMWRPGRGANELAQTAY